MRRSTVVKVAIVSAIMLVFLGTIVRAHTRRTPRCPMGWELPPDVQDTIWAALGIDQKVEIWLGRLDGPTDEPDSTWKVCEFDSLVTEADFDLTDYVETGEKVDGWWWSCAKVVRYLNGGRYEGPCVVDSSVVIWEIRITPGCIGRYFFRDE